MSPAPNNQKETIYIDVDDEITSIIDKLHDTETKIVALVLPKRTSALQSIVNMKLLKRTADQLKKRVVLITSETSLLPLAGAVGMHVAKTLTSKPVIPSAPMLENAAEEANENGIDVPDAAIPAAAAVAASKRSSAAAAPIDDTEENIEVDNEPSATGTSKADKAAKAGLLAGVFGKKKATAAGAAGSNKKLKVPSFEKFRTRLFLGIAAFIALIVLAVFGLSVLPKAKVVLKTDTSSSATDVTFTADPDADSLDKTAMIVPAKLAETKKTDSQKVPATGQKDLGTKASGKMVLVNCINDGEPHTVPAGTGFSSGQFTFISDEAVTLPPALYSGSNCKSADFGQDKTVAVTAAQAGDKYNLGSRAYSVPDSLNAGIGSITAKGSDMTGGTSKIVKIVSLSDIDGAKQKILESSQADAKTELTKDLEKDNYIALQDTLAANEPLVTSSPNVDAEASEVTVNATHTFTMLGAQKAAVKTLVTDAAKKDIDTSKQAITNDGLNDAIFRVVSTQTNKGAKINVKSTVVAGPQLDANEIKQVVKGKKRGEALRLLQARPGITDAQISYSPFWVTSTPKNTDKIIVQFQNAGNNK
jgi:hypothetical protein